MDVCPMPIVYSLYDRKLCNLLHTSERRRVVRYTAVHSPMDGRERSILPCHTPSLPLSATLDLETLLSVGPPSLPALHSFSLGNVLEI
jgi:hypothetical protein